jgi:hypothetical protein
MRETKKHKHFPDETNKIPLGRETFAQTAIRKGATEILLFKWKGLNWWLLNNIHLKHTLMSKINEKCPEHSYYKADKTIMSIFSSKVQTN